MSPFFVSVIVPVYNGETFLAEAIGSILQQDYSPLEIIVVDDGSTDRTAQIATRFANDVTYVYQANAGPAAARNRGLKTARGNVVSFLDADDLWWKDKLHLQLSYLANNPAVDIVLGRTQHLCLLKSMDGNPKFEPFLDPMILVSLGGAIFRRSVFAKIGLFTEDLRYTDDWDWFMRARELRVPMIIHADTVQFYRRHAHNMTNQVDLNNQYMLRMLKKSLERRRQTNHGLAASLPKLSTYREDSTRQSTSSVKEEH